MFQCFTWSLSIINIQFLWTRRVTHKHKDYWFHRNACWWTEHEVRWDRYINNLLEWRRAAQQDGRSPRCVIRAWSEPACHLLNGLALAIIKLCSHSHTQQTRSGVHHNTSPTAMICANINKTLRQQLARTTLYSISHELVWSPVNRIEETSITHP